MDFACGNATECHSHLSGKEEIGEEEFEGRARKTHNNHTVFLFLVKSRQYNRSVRLCCEEQCKIGREIYFSGIANCVNSRRHRLLVKSSANLSQSGLLFPLLLQLHHGDRLIPSDRT